MPVLRVLRQDRKSKGREPISARLVSDFFATAGADRIISVDLHSGQIQGSSTGPVDHLTATPLLTEYLRLHAPAGDFVMVSPDTGRSKVAEQAASHAGSKVDVASVYKRRPKDVINKVEALDVMGDVEGRMCVLIDDMIDTAGHHLRRRRAPRRRGGGGRNLGHVPPTPSCRIRRSTASRTPRSRGWW